MNRIHYNVIGLQNEQIKTQIKNVLDKIDGVQMVNIDLGRSSIEIGYDESADVNVIKQSIEHVGCNIV